MKFLKPPARKFAETSRLGAVKRLRYLPTVDEFAVEAIPAGELDGLRLAMGGPEETNGRRTRTVAVLLCAPGRARPI